MKRVSMHPIEACEDKPKIENYSDNNMFKAGETVCSRPPSFDHVDFSKLSVYKALIPILFSLRIAGLYYVRNEATITVKFNIAALLSKIYCIIVMLITWMGFIVNCTLFYGVPNMILLLFVTTLVLQASLAAVKVTCLFKAAYDRKALSKFIICMTSLAGNDDTILRWVRKAAIICCVICWPLLVAGITIIFYITFGLGIMSNDLAGLITSILTAVYFIASFIFFDCLELLISIMVRKQFLLLSFSIRENTGNAGNYHGSLEKERIKFLEILRCIKAADKFLSIHHAASLGINVANVCIFIFIISYNPQLMNNDFLRYFMILDLLMCFTDMSLVCTSGILITSGVSKIFLL